VDIDGVGYEPEGDISVGGRPLTAAETEPVRHLLTVGALCNDAALRPPDKHDASARSERDAGRWQAVGDPTEAALLTAAAKAGCPDPRTLAVTYRRIGETPFDSLRKRMSTLHRLEKGQILVCLKGAPESVLDPAVLAESTDLLDRAREESARLATGGYRVLAVASGERDGVPPQEANAESELRLLGLVAMSDPPKPTATATLSACRAAGITPVLITGDHPATARHIAKSVGLLMDQDAGHVVTGPDVAAGLTPDLTRVTVFARTDPKQKLDIVEAWRSHGAVTAMTGDGVNDGPALHQADIGVAMGARGTEVARQAADLILTNDELSTVVAAVEEGRRVYDNIRRFLVYGLAGGAAEILVMLVGPILGLPLPLRAGQILWINLLTHGLTGVAMGAEPASSGAMARPPRPPGQHILGAGAWQRLIMIAIVVSVTCLGAALGAKALDLRWQSVLFLALLAGQLGVVLGLRARLLTRRNPFLPLSVLTSALLAVAAMYVPFLRSVLDTGPVGFAGLGLTAGAGLAGFAAGRISRTAVHQTHGQ
jgi:Ca2+-transporting ATPase